MFKPNYSTCIECKQQRMIVVKKGYCKRCNELKKGKSKPIKKIKSKRKETGEIKIFREIWQERDSWCEWCGKGILEFSVANYHHVIEKSKAPHLRLDKSNIVKICFDCHFKAHNKSKSGE